MTNDELNSIRFYERDEVLASAKGYKLVAEIRSDLMATNIPASTTIVFALMYPSSNSSRVFFTLNSAWDAYNEVTQ